MKATQQTESCEGEPSRGINEADEGSGQPLSR